MKIDPEALALWVERISEREMPVFGKTAQEMARLAGDDTSSSSALSAVILQDAGMTARVLRLANSAYYNSSGQPLSTVSRAVVLLGFNAIRSICLSVGLLDHLLHGRPNPRLVNELANGFYAAALSRALAKAVNDESPEEIFVATLLYRLGHLAFWSYAGDLGDQLESELQNSPDHSERAELNVLNFRLVDLTDALVKCWRLGTLLETALNAKHDVEPRVKLIRYGHRVAELREDLDRRKDLRAVTDQIGQKYQLSQKVVTSLVEGCVLEASRIAGSFGATAISHHLSLPEKHVWEKEAGTTASPALSLGSPVFLEPDPVLQLHILRDISSMIVNRADVNNFLETVLEGIFRGIGMDRTIFALYLKDQRKLILKSVLSIIPGSITEGLTITVNNTPSHVFDFALHTNEPLLIKDISHAPKRLPLPPELKTIASTSSYFLGPLMVQSKVVAIFYADRAASNRPLDQESFENFKHFWRQANLGLEILTRPA